MSKKLMLLIVLIFLVTDMKAQKKKVTTKKAANTVTIKATTKNFGTPGSVSQITDVTEADPVYASLKNLTENYGVIIAYDDNTFKGKEPLKRGDFIVALNSALVNLRSKMDAAGLDTSLINTYDRNRMGAYLTSINQIKDVPENSIYYSAAKSLIERWGIGESFSVVAGYCNSVIADKKFIYL